MFSYYYLFFYRLRREGRREKAVSDPLRRLCISAVIVMVIVMNWLIRKPVAPGFSEFFFQGTVMLGHLPQVMIVR